MQQKTTVYLAFYLGRKKDNPKTTTLDRVSCFCLDEPYSHVELAYDYSDISNIGLTLSSSPRDGGIRQTRIDFSTGRWHLYKIETFKTEDEILEWFSSRTGIKYDYLGAIGLFVPFIGQVPSRYFCTEAVGECLGVENASTLSPIRLLAAFPEAVRVL